MALKRVSRARFPCHKVRDDSLSKEHMSDVSKKALQSKSAFGKEVGELTMTGESGVLYRKLEMMCGTQSWKQTGSIMQERLMIPGPADLSNQA